MLGVLVESRPVRRRSIGGTMFSVGVHVVLIVAGVTATVRADTEERIETEPPMIYLPPPATFDPPTPKLGAAEGKALEQLPPRIDVTVDLPVVGAPPVGVPLETADWDISARGTPRGTPSSTGGESNPYFEWMVDVPAKARSGNPAPNYPRALRDAGIEGAVLARFVIDTTGRVDTASIRALAASHALFEQSVRDAISRMRFTPAETGGRKVRLLVQQSFAFRLER